MKENQRKMSESERSKHVMETLADNYRDVNGLVEVIKLVNSDLSNVDAHPSGIVTIHPADAQVHPDSISNELFDHIVVCRVFDPERKLADKDFQGKESKLNKQIPQYAAKNPPRMYGVRSEKGGDSGLWSAELGPLGYAGVYKQVSARDTDYYIVVRASVPEACKEFKHAVFSGKPLTFEQLYYDPKYNFTKNLAKRNAERLAYCVADAIGVKIQQIEDASAFTKKSYIAKPWRAIPDKGMSHVMSRIAELSWHNTPHVGIFHKICPRSDIQDESFVSAGPYEGITLFSMKHAPVHGVGLPLNTGPNKDKSNMKELSEQEKTRRSRGFVSEGDEENIHALIHPKNHQKVDDKFLKEMIKMGWRQEGANNRRTLVPVIVKVADPEITRK